MLRLIGNRTIPIRLVPKLVRSMCVQQNPDTLLNRRAAREKVDVSLCGIINDNPVQLDHGTIVVPLITRNDHDEFHAKHRIHLLTESLQQSFIDRLHVGDRIYVNGVIAYSDFISADGYHKQTGRIIANRLYPCEQNAADTDRSSDVNEIKLFGRVVFPANNTERATFLEVATYFFDRRDQQFKRRLHTLLIRDNDKQRELASSINVGARVFVHGSLKTEHSRTKDEKLRGLYYIEPKKLIVCQEAEKQLEEENLNTAA